MNRQIFNKICRVKRRVAPNERVILFGSQARGDARPDSDWDLLVLLNKEKRNYNEDFDKYAYPFIQLGMMNDVLITPKIFTKKEWERQKPSLFYKNVENDKIEII